MFGVTVKKKFEDRAGGTAKTIHDWTAPHFSGVKREIAFHKKTAMAFVVIAERLRKSLDVDDYPAAPYGC